MAGTIMDRELEEIVADAVPRGELIIAIDVLSRLVEADTFQGDYRRSTFSFTVKARAVLEVLNDAYILGG